jgi:uncharacterized membrane protein
MNDNYAVILILRWLHIVSATLAVGVPIYFRFVVMPALATLDEDSRNRVTDALAKRWKMFVHILIVVFLATGLYNFLGIARWRGPEFDADAKRTYHMLFGIKLLIALVIFTLSSALVGRASIFAGIRNKAAMWWAILGLLGVVVVVLSGVMRYMPFPG